MFKKIASVVSVVAVSLVALSASASAWDVAARGSVTCEGNAVIAVTNLTTSEFMDARPDDPNTASGWAQRITVEGQSAIAAVDETVYFSLSGKAVGDAVSVGVSWAIDRSDYVGETLSVTLEAVEDCPVPTVPTTAPEPTPTSEATVSDGGPTTVAPTTPITTSSTVQMAELPVTGNLLPIILAGVGALLVIAGTAMVRKSA
jgi:hypothetical protein